MLALCEVSMVGLGTAISLGLGAAQTAAPLIAAARRSPLEKDIAAQVEADRARLAGGAGGYSAGERQALTAEALNNIYAQARSQQEQLAAANPNAASSGASEARAQGLQTALNAATLQAQSGVRDADVATGNQQRAEVAQREQMQAAENKKRREAIAAALQGKGMANGQMYSTENKFAAATQGAKAAGELNQSALGQGLSQVAGAM
jgi:hypothetical protein